MFLLRLDLLTKGLFLFQDKISQLILTCSKSKTKTLEKGVV